MYPLQDWKQLRRGYTFGQKTHYNDFHIGLDVMAPSWTKLFAPSDGNVVTGIGSQGGNTVYLHVAGGDYLVRFLHLAKFAKTGPVKEGDLIGYTGNTGLSTGPHLHVDVSRKQLKLYDRNNFVDPERYFEPVIINIATIGMTTEAFDGLRDKVEELSGIEILRKEYPYPLPTSLNQDTAYFIANTLDVPEKFVFMCPRSSLTWQMSYYYPKLNQCISVMTLAATPSMYAFELKHQLFLWYNENRGSLPALENLDWNAPTDDMIRAQYARIMPHIELLTGLRYSEHLMGEKIVKGLQAFEPYHDPVGVKYWGGIIDKEGLEGVWKYILARKPHLVGELQKHINQVNEI